MAASGGVEEEDAIAQLFGAGDGDGAIDHEYESYLKSLTSYSLEKLSKEPENLREQAHTIKQQMQTLSYTHYKSFIQTSNSIQSVSKEMLDVDKHLESLVPHLGSLAETCERFALSAQSFVSLRSAHRRTLHNHAMLLESDIFERFELLEIPQLMDTCVRNGCYEEALQLESFAKKLAKSFPHIKVVSDIVSEMDVITTNLLSHLIHQLCTQIQFPISLNAIGYLRRLQLYNELELRVTFLMCRDTWLLNSLSSIPDSNAYSYLNKLIDQSRTHLFDIIHQYKAIFSDDSSSHDDPMKDGGLLYGWISQKIMAFMKTLDSFLPRIEEGAAIGRLLDQCMSYGASLARVGVDVRGLLPPLFEKSIYNLFASTLTSATHHFLENIKSYQFPPSTSPGATTQSKAPKTIETTQPPLILLDHPPLAVLTNAILGAYNELRQCAPLSLQYALTARLRESLVAIVAAIQSLPNHFSFDTNQEMGFSNLCKVVCEIFLPYVAQCFHNIYSAAASHTPLIIDIVPIDMVDTTGVPEVVEDDLVLQNNVVTTSTSTGSANREPTKPNDPLHSLHHDSDHHLQSNHLHCESTMVSSSAVGIALPSTASVPAQSQEIVSNSVASAEHDNSTIPSMHPATNPTGAATSSIDTNPTKISDITTTPTILANTNINTINDTTPTDNTNISTPTPTDTIASTDPASSIDHDSDAGDAGTITDTNPTTIPSPPLHHDPSSTTVPSSTIIPSDTNNQLAPGS